MQNSKFKHGTACGKWVNVATTFTPLLRTNLLFEFCILNFELRHLSKEIYHP
jgi:hypothetical protein